MTDLTEKTGHNDFFYEFVDKEITEAVEEMAALYGEDFNEYDVRGIVFTTLKYYSINANKFKAWAES